MAAYEHNAKSIGTDKEMSTMICSRTVVFGLGVLQVHTDDERNHGSSVATRLFKALDQLLDLPYLDVLLCFVRLWVTHDGGCILLRAV